jgi:hypothetical protein
MIRFTVPQRALAHPRLLQYMAAALILGRSTGSFMGRTRTRSHELSAGCFKLLSVCDSGPSSGGSGTQWTLTPRSSGCALKRCPRHGPGWLPLSACQWGGGGVTAAGPASDRLATVTPSRSLSSPRTPRRNLNVTAPPGRVLNPQKPQPADSIEATVTLGGSCRGGALAH